MARTVRNSNLDSRTARLKLEPRPKPYFAKTGVAGLHIGYRRLQKQNGTWIARRYQGASGEYEAKGFGQADDYAEADGGEILTWHQACGRLTDQAPPIRHGSGHTIQNAVDDYVTYAKLHTSTGREVEGMLLHYILRCPSFDPSKQVSALTEDDFQKWPAWALIHPPRSHGKKPKDPEKLSPDETAEKERKRKDRVNRVINNVLGCFNYAHENKSEAVPSNRAWSKLRRFKDVEKARAEWLEESEAVRLANACEPDFRKILRGGLLTGARWSELCRLLVSDFDNGGPVVKGVTPNATLHISKSKAKKPRHVYLSNEGRAAFIEWTAGRKHSERIFLKADGTPWGKDDQRDPIMEANARAGIDPPINFHNASRHTYASALVKGGVHLSIVAESLGHTTTRMVEKHYGHLAPSHVADEIRAKLPAFGVKVDSKVRKLRP
jgi:integrase